MIGSVVVGGAHGSMECEGMACCVLTPVWKQEGALPLGDKHGKFGHMGMVWRVVGESARSALKIEICYG